MNNATPTVFIVDDNESLCEGLTLVINSIGLNVKTYHSAQTFLDAYDHSFRPACLLLDIRLPGTSGLQLQEELIEKNINIPIIIITGHGDVPMCVDVMNKGAIDFIQKPFRDQHVLQSIEKAIIQDKRTLESEKTKSLREDQFKLLTPREREVLNLIINGKKSKEIAAELNLSQKTIDGHRGHIMKKVCVNNVAQLVKLFVTDDNDLYKI